MNLKNKSKMVPMYSLNLLVSEEGYFDIIIKPTNYGAMFIVKFVDKKLIYVLITLDHYAIASLSANDPDLLYKWIQENGG